MWGTQRAGELHVSERSGCRIRGTRWDSAAGTVRGTLGSQSGSIRAGGPARISAAGVEERILLLDGRQTPVVEPAELGGVELRGERLVGEVLRKVGGKGI